MTSTFSVANAPQLAAEDGAALGRQFEQMLFAFSRRAERAARDHGERIQAFWTEVAEAQRRFAQSQKDGKLAEDAQSYATDAGQCFALTLDVLRERADQDAAHEAAGTPPVLIYDHEVVLDGKTLPRPSNKVLLKILPPAGVEVMDWKR